MPRKAIKSEFSASLNRSYPFLNRSYPFKTFFAWQIGFDYRQWVRFLTETICPGRGFQGRRPSMTQLDSELTPPFEIAEPAEWRGPHLFYSPHLGPGLAPEYDPVGQRIDAPVRDRGAGRVAGTDHLQFASFGLGLPAGFPHLVAHRSGGAAPFRGFVHGRVDRGFEPARFSRGPG